MQVIASSPNSSIGAVAEVTNKTVSATAAKCVTESTFAAEAAHSVSGRFCPGGRIVRYGPCTVGVVPGGTSLWTMTEGSVAGDGERA